MSGESVLIVDRYKKLGWRTRFHLPALLRALWIALRHMRASARAAGNFDERPIETREQRLANYPTAFRGMPVLVADEEGALRCDGCARCVAICPARCIELAGAQSGSGVEPDTFEIDMGRCMFCGLCEEACPTGALVMSPHAELDVADRDGLVFDKSALTVSAALLGARVGGGGEG